jgi:glycolate oxidase
MDKKIIKKLKQIVGPDNLSTAREDLLCYSYDGTAMEYPPAAVAFPGTTEEVSAIMQLASEASFPVVPRGAGTGMSGGALPVAGGLVLAMSRFNRILEIDTDNHVAVVEPGVITGHFQEEVKRLGLFYPPDPASHKFCTLGGNVAECAGGPSAVKYGVTRDYVLGLEIVLPDGRLMNTGVRTAKGVVGYDLTRLFIGSEGTLGIVTGIVVKLLACPLGRSTFLVLCSSIKQATELVTRILATITPCTLEYMDKTALSLIADRLPFPLPAATNAMLLVELDGDKESVELHSKNFAVFLNAEKNLVDVRQANSDEEVEALWAARKSISPAAFDLRPHKISEDVVVPRSRIPELVACTEELAGELDLPIFTFGHAGDGNIHVNIMVDKNNPHEVEKAHTAKKRLFQKVLALSGTLSGEHGVGITKSEYLGLELDDVSIDVMKKIKNLFDPQNILNPGKIFPL